MRKKETNTELVKKKITAIDNWGPVSLGACGGQHREHRRVTLPKS